ncbi:hypothetical protein THRCLA_20770 [Thraustotheca clavata]|uniref:Porphobilinogen deaminase N-terminal domain-containing protein n=1 Tax=Thraustotheca clavata TaxID=74557 RepID=A0A1W0A3N1_9STRA|nr:hypothetical protein THRCLA_20770 [Thraustotheca clavata]
MDYIDGDLLFSRLNHKTVLVIKIEANTLHNWELEEFLAGRTDFAVHCLKDIPTILPEGFVLRAICESEQYEDVTPNINKM